MSIKQFRNGVTGVTTDAATGYWKQCQAHKSLMSRSLSSILGLNKGKTKVVVPGANPEISLSMVGDKDLLDVAFSSATPNWLYKAAKQEMTKRGSMGWSNHNADVDTYPTCVMDVLTNPTAVEVVR